MRVYQKAEKLCENCGTKFSVPNYRRNKARFCNASCKGSFIAARHLNKGPKPWASRNLDGHRHKSGSRFKKGHVPWNSGVKGLQLSPDTQFKKGCESNRKLPIGTVRIRASTENDKNQRAWVKIGDPSAWKERAVLVWEKSNGPTPHGCVIHHRNRNTLDDDIGNLQCMTRAEHLLEHREELEAGKCVKR